MIWLPVPDKCWCFGPWFWSQKLWESFVMGGTNRLGAKDELGVSLWWERVAGSELPFCFEGCNCTELPLKPTEVCLLLLVVCPSLWALLSKALRLFSSIFRCCSAVSWLDMTMNFVATSASSLLWSFTNSDDNRSHSGLAKTSSYLQTSDQSKPIWTINTVMTAILKVWKLALQHPLLTVAANVASVGGNS